MNSLFTIEENSDGKVKSIFNCDKLVEGRLANVSLYENTTEEAPKRKKPKKEEVYKYDCDNDEKRSSSKLKANEPYSKTYKETQSLLKDTIAEIDGISRTVSAHLSKLNNSASVRNYKYITDLTNTQAALLNSKIAAIREMNSAITNSNRLDLNRAKDLKLEDKQDNDKYIMDLYNALINTPINNGGVSRLGPSMIESTTRVDDRQYMPFGEDDYGYNSYMKNMSPEQNRMFMESNPNIQTVVVYDQSTGDKKFDVVDVRTNEHIPNMPTPDKSFLEDMTISFKTMTAKNTNTSITYPLVVIGEDPISNF